MWLNILVSLLDISQVCAVQTFSLSLLSPLKYLLVQLLMNAQFSIFFKMHVHMFHLFLIRYVTTFKHHPNYCPSVKMFSSHASDSIAMNVKKKNATCHTNVLRT